MQTHRSMECKVSSEINPGVYDQLILTKVPKIPNGERAVSSINGLEKTTWKGCSSKLAWLLEELNSSRDAGVRASATPIP